MTRGCVLTPHPGPPGGHHGAGAPVRYRRVGARLLPPVQERQTRLRQGNLRGGKLERCVRKTGCSHEIVLLNMTFI